MSRTYNATGINLKSMPLGEADRLVTVLTREFGLIRAVAPGSRKQNSKLGARSGLFVVNHLLLAKGRSLDKITQAETLESYPGLSRDLKKLAASQYLAEVVLGLALSEQPQIELYELLTEHLRRLEGLPRCGDGQQEVLCVLAHLSHGVFHLLALAGIAPQVQTCCLTQLLLSPDLSDPDWRVGFSAEAGGAVKLAPDVGNGLRRPVIARGGVVMETTNNYDTDTQAPPLPRLSAKLNAIELTLLQQLSNAHLPQTPTASLDQIGSTLGSFDVAWARVERSLRDYAQYHIGQAIRSATLVEALASSEL